MEILWNVCSHIIAIFPEKSAFISVLASPPGQALTSPHNVREVGPRVPKRNEKRPMEMLNPYCGIGRDISGVVRLTICNAGSLNILGSAAIDGVREGLQRLATDQTIRV